MKEEYSFLTYLLKSPFFQIWEKLTLDNDLYFRIYFNQKKIRIHYSGEHILTLQYRFYSSRKFKLQDRYEEWWKELVLDDIFSIINNIKKEIDGSERHYKNWETVSQYKYAALDKRIILTEYGYFIGTRIDMVLVDNISNRIVFVEVKRIDNEDFETTKLKNQLYFYNNCAVKHKDSVLKEMTELINIRKELNLYELPVEKEYFMEEKPLLLVLDCNDKQSMERHISKYTDKVKNDLCGLIYTNKIIKIDMTKFKDKLYYEFDENK